MGYRSAWVAVRGVGLERVLAEIGWVDTGRRIEFVDPGLYGFELRGWAVVLGSGSEHWVRVLPALAERLSGLGLALHLAQSDTSMNAQIAAFREGRLLWSVMYSGTGGVSEPEVRGSVPPELEAILARCRSAQEAAGGRSADVDHMYEVAIELGRALVGFRHDGSLEDEVHIIEES